jgi:hypothetical protein
MDSLNGTLARQDKTSSNQTTQDNKLHAIKYQGQWEPHYVITQL